MIASRLALVVGQLQRGGAERQLFELAIRLDRSRLDPLVVCLSEVVDPYAGKLTEAGIDVVVLPRAGHRDFSRVRSLAGILSRHRIDLVHSFLIAANAYTWAATRLAGRRPYIASSRTCIPPRGRLGLWVHRRAFRGAQAVIANAKAVMEFTRDLYALPESRFTVIPNGVDLAPFEEAGRDREARRAMVRALFGLDDGEAMTGVQPGDMSGVVAGVVGRLSPEKNLPLLLEVARRLRAGAGPSIRFLVIGDGPERGRIEEEIRREDLGRCVILAGPSDDVASTLAACDLFVQTSDTEGLPNAVMEAMAASLPVVATRAGGTEELVEDGRSGWVVPRGDAPALAAAIARLAADEVMRSTFGARGRTRIASEFSVDRMVERTVALYDRVLG